MPQDRRGITAEEIKVASAYGKDGMQNFINKSEILYKNPDKQIISRWTKRTRLQLPVGKVSADYNNIVSENNKKSTQEKKNSLSVDIKHSLNEKAYQEALEKHDTKTMQKLLEDAAKENGYDIKGWHGTNEGGFTEFNAKYSDDGISLFIAKNKETAQSYTENYSENEVDLNSNKKQEGLYHVAVKMQNPLNDTPFLAYHSS